MNRSNRLNNNEISFLSNYGETFHSSMSKIMEDLAIKKDKLDDPKYWELRKELDKLKKEVISIKEIIEGKVGY